MNAAGPSFRSHRPCGGAQAAASTDPPDILERTRRFADARGRRPRIYFTYLDAVGTGRQIRSLASDFADGGFNVDLNTRSQAPENVARTAVENDVHCIGLTGVSGRHRPLLRRLAAALTAEGGDGITLAVWTDPAGETPDAGDNALLFAADAPSLACAEILLQHLCR